MPISAPKIPDGLPELMRGLAKSVIKENPENLYVHAAEYFENLIRERDGHLDQGYQTFNAYQVYADYKEKTREKLGLTKDPSLSDGIGGDGDESGSGGSESKIRGRKRRRARKPSSRERENPATMVGNPSVSDEGEPQKLKSLSEDSAPVPVVEQEIVKVHYNPPEAVPSPVRVVSAQSVEAEQAVSSILDDGLILNSDGNDGKDTGDELADNGDDVGTAPSTAEITERTVAVDADSGAAVALQDMETCFMHANVDDLLEKHSEDQPEPETTRDVGTVGNETTVLSALEGEDIPEGPQIIGETDNDVAEVEQAPVIENPEKNSNENEVQKASEEQLQIEVEENTSSSPIAEQSVVEAGVDGMENKEPEDLDNIQPLKDAEEAVSSSNEPADEASVDQSKSETDNLSEDKDVPADAVSNTEVDEGKGEDPIVSSEITNAAEPGSSSPNKSVEQEHVPSEPASNEAETLLEKQNELAVVETPEDAPTISSRMGFEQDESDAGNDENENALLAPVDNENVEQNAEPEVQEAIKADEINVTDQPNEIGLNDEVVKDEGNEASKQIDVTVPNSPDNGDSLNDNDTVAKDATDKPSEVAPSESTSVADEETFAETEEQTNAALEDISVAEDTKDEKDKQADEALAQSEPQNINETSETNTTPEPVSNDVTVEPSRENIDFVEPAGTSEETVPTDVKSSELSTDPIVDPRVDDRDEEPQKENLESNVGASDDLKSDHEDKAEKSDSQSNDTEVNENNNETGQNDLLTKDQSLEDVAHVEAALSSSTNDAVIASAEESVPINPVEPAEDSLNANTDQGDEANAQLKVVPVTEEDDIVVQKHEIPPKGSDEVKVEDDTKVGENPEANEPTVQGLTTETNPTLENVVIDEMQKLLQDDKNDPACAEDTPEGDNNSGNKDLADTVDDSNELKVDEKNDILASAPIEERSGEVADIPLVNLEESLDKSVPQNDQSSDLDQTVMNESPSDGAVEPKDDTLAAPVDPSALADEELKQTESLEEVVEEPCVKREISPSKSVRLEKDDSSEKQVEELEEIKKVDLSQLSKDSAEALFYTLKKSELENQEPDGDTVGTEEESPKGMAGTQQQTTEDDDQDVVVKEEPQPIPEAEHTKRTFTDDFLDENPITGAPTTASMPSDGGEQHDPLSIGQDRASLDVEEQKDEFNPMVMVSMRSKQYQEQLHSGAVVEKVDPEVPNEGTSKRPMMRRCMTEMSGLQRYEAAMEDELVETRPEDPSYVEEEDQFDGYYIGHIKNKILASSVSVADSDCPDGTRSSVESVDENNVRTALETIASTDTESTIASQATIQQAGRRSYLRKHSQNTSSNIPYASFGNAAIDQSLDEFIEREEQHKQDEAMAEAATKIQRSYRTHKKKLLRDYHSTMRTFTEDQSAESGEEYAANVIQIKLDQRRTEASDPAAGDGGEESDTTTGGKVGLGATGKRPMYSLNIDEYDTVARRMTLTRGVAMQRNSTPDDDSGKSANASTDRKPSLNSPIVKDSTPASGSGESPSSDEKPAGPDTTDRSSSDEPEQKDARSSSRSKPKSSPTAVVAGPEQVPRMVTSRTTFAPLDVQNLLLIARQRTMPVQIDSSVIRVLPKHMRKRISSAGMLNTNGKRK